LLGRLASPMIRKARSLWNLRQWRNISSHRHKVSKISYWIIALGRIESHGDFFSGLSCRSGPSKNWQDQWLQSFTGPMDDSPFLTLHIEMSMRLRIRNQLLRDHSAQEHGTLFMIVGISQCTKTVNPAVKKSGIGTTPRQQMKHHLGPRSFPNPRRTALLHKSRPSCRFIRTKASEQPAAAAMRWLSRTSGPHSDSLFRSHPALPRILPNSPASPPWPSLYR
jgi:hypothetical protein